MVKKKKCSKCGEVKGAEEFYEQPTGKDGLKAECKKCAAEQRKAYYEKNKEKLAEWRKAYYEKNKEKLAEWQKEYYEKNKDKISEYKKEYSEKNKDKISECRKAHRKKNRIIINGECFNLNTCPEEIKPLVEALIILRKKNKILKEIR